MDGRARVVGSDQNLHLTENFVSSGLVWAEDVDGPCPLSIEPQVLSEGVGHYHLEALLIEVLHGVPILMKVSGREPLINDIEEGHEAVGFHDFTYLLPLLGVWFHSCGIVPIGLEKHDGAWRHGSQVLEEVFLIQGIGIVVIVLVVPDIQASIS